MISWMQKNNRYLVWTIWVATITFIGAGFVGWGSYKFGLSGDAIAKVGNVEIDKDKYQIAYKSVYNMYNQQLQGTLDNEKAKELGVEKQAFEAVKAQALFLNLAKDYGIETSDNEVAKALEGINAFWVNGKFNKSTYEQYLSSEGYKPKMFEDEIRDELTIAKVSALLKTKSFDFENRAMSAPLGISDELAITILNPKDATVKIDENGVKNFWQAHQNSYKNPEKFEVEVVWTPVDNIAVTKEEIENFYNTKGDNYSDQNGNKLPIEIMTPMITQELKIQKGEKIAQRAYIDFKKSKVKASQTLTISSDDSRFDKDTIAELKGAKVGDFIKPKVVNNEYATFKLLAITPSRPMTFDEAKPFASKDYASKMVAENLQKIAKEKEKNIDRNTAQSVIWLDINGNKPLLSLSSQESLQFLQNLLTSRRERGIINLSDKVIIYKILSQKITKNSQKDSELIGQSVTQLKNNVLTKNILDTLNQKYKTTIYAKGMGFE